MPIAYIFQATIVEDRRPTAPILDLLHSHRAGRVVIVCTVTESFVHFLEVRQEKKQI